MCFGAARFRNAKRGTVRQNFDVHIAEPQVLSAWSCIEHTRYI